MEISVEKLHFPTPMYYNMSSLKGFSLELGMGARGQKTRMMGLPGQERSLTISSAIWIQYTKVTDIQMDNSVNSIIR